jgi:hypothetical protein
MLKSFIKKIPGTVYLYGFYQKWRCYSSVRKDFKRFRQLAGQDKKRFSMLWSERFLCLSDKTASTGFEPHYTYHPAWAARVLAYTKPEFHIDISSTLQFAGIVSAFIPVRFYDYRPAALKLSGLTSGAADLTQLPFQTGSIMSLSCMHVIEHVGLGRYGDPIDPDGDLKAIAELKRVLAKNGNLLFVVPIGRPRIVFNAHRIYSYEQVMRLFSDFSLKEYALVPDDYLVSGMVVNASGQLTDEQKWGCGCFWFSK